MSTVGEKKEKRSMLQPFVIEARTPRNQDLLIQNLDGMKLRGAVSTSIEVFDRNWEGTEDDLEDDLEEREMMTRPAAANNIDGIGELPGQQLYVNPSTGEWKTSDPLYKKPAVLERVRRALRRSIGIAVVGQKLRGLRPKQGKINPDQMKSLCRELSCFVTAREAKVLKGRMPSEEEIDNMPGRELLNWMNRQNWKQPNYKDQYEDWERRSNLIDGSV